MDTEIILWSAGVAPAGSKNPKKRRKVAWMRQDPRQPLSPSFVRGII